MQSHVPWQIPSRASRTCCVLVLFSCFASCLTVSTHQAVLKNKADRQYLAINGHGMGIDATEEMNYKLHTDAHMGADATVETGKPRRGILRSPAPVMTEERLRWTRPKYSASSVSYFHAPHARNSSDHASLKSYFHVPTGPEAAMSHRSSIMREEARTEGGRKKESGGSYRRSAKASAEGLGDVEVSWATTASNFNGSQAH